MNTMHQPQPLETSSNADLRGSWHALLRAAARARQIAAQTGTALVVVCNGVSEHAFGALRHQLVYQVGSR